MCRSPSLVPSAAGLHHRLTRGLALAAAAAWLWPAAVSGQDFVPQNRQIGNLTVEVVRLPYEVTGSTAQEIYDDLRSNGWFRTQRVYNWTYQPQGGNVGSCRLNDFQLILNTRVLYPQWDAPEGVDPQLVAAWEAFSETMDEYWSELLEQDRRLARRLQRQVESIAEPCTAANQAVRRLWERYRGRDVAYEEGITGDTDTQLRWPPEGFVLDIDETAPVRPPEPGPPSEDVASGVAPGVAGSAAGGEVEFTAMPEMAESFQDAAGRDFSNAGVASPALIMGLIRDGSILGVEPVGAADTDAPAPDPDAQFVFSGFAEVLVSVLAVALDGGGLMDLEAPVSTWLPELDGRLGQVTLRQLLTHRGGLDNAPLPGSGEWAATLDGMSDDRLFTEPGAVFSYSRYSYPLAVRAMERGVGQPVASLMQAAIFGPLGMSRTNVGTEGVQAADMAPGAMIPEGEGGAGAGSGMEGLPLVVTTVPDVLRFLESVTNGTVRLMDAEELYAPDPRAPDEEVAWAGGLWWRRFAGAEQYSMVCAPGEFGGGAGLSMLSGANSGIVLWARETWPHESARFLLAATSRGQDQPEDPWWFMGPGYRSGLDADTWGRCHWPATMSLAGVPSGLGARVDELDGWLGSYENGGQIVGLDADGERVIWAGSELDVVRISVSEYAARAGAQLVFPFQLVRDQAGRRYIVTGDRAYVHTDDVSGDDVSGGEGTNE